MARFGRGEISHGLILLDLSGFGENLLRAATLGGIWQDMEIFGEIRRDAIGFGEIGRNSAQLGDTWRALSYTIY